MAKTKTTIADLNEYLFEQLDRLTDDSLSSEELEKEIGRSKAVTDIGEKIIQAGQLMFNVKKHMDEYGVGGNVDMTVLGIGSGE